LRVSPTAFLRLNFRPFVAGIVESLRQVRPLVTKKETGALHDPQPFLFFARAETLYVFEARSCILQLFARPATVHNNVPTLTCVESTGDAGLVEARLNSTVTPSFPERTFAEMTVIEGLEGFADTEIASTAVPETPHRISDTKTAEADRPMNLLISKTARQSNLFG